jgi:hypothetical protein
MLTPDHIAHELGIDPKTLRRKLRKNWNRNHSPNSRWFFTRAEADEIKRRYPDW